MNNEKLLCRTLDEADMPHIRVWRDGTVENLETGCVTTDNVIGLRTYTDNILIKLSKQKLLGYAFDAPWNQSIIPYRHLDFLGCSLYYAIANGDIFTTTHMMYLKHRISSTGYLRVAITKDDGSCWYVDAHRLIALAFIPNPENKATVNHKDGNKLNNHVDNLEWMHQWENNRHAKQHGLRHMAMTDNMVHQVCKLLEHGIYTQQQIADMVGCTTHNVRHILRGTHYHISSTYTVPYYDSVQT